MEKTEYSHYYLVGALNGHISPSQLSDEWQKVDNADEYAKICSMYYQGHVDAMLDVNEKRPSFLKDVAHYRLSYNDSGGGLGRKIVLEGMKKNMGKEEFTYHFLLQGLHLYFFPLGIVLFAIEIDDSGTALDELTAAHNAMTQTYTYKKEVLTSALSPILKLLPSDDVTLILGIGNKFKLYQVIQLESETVKDSLLYELGTSSPIGCVGTRHSLAPSQAYYDSIMNHNVVSAFSEWKGLALMDSFTMISVAAKREDWTWDRHFYLWNNYYFQLIYLRCLLEKTFCSSRNTHYRMTEESLDISEEIKNMERYYFYEKISHNFLPNLIYKAMSVGLELKEEREELSKQVKERAEEEKKLRKEKDERDAEQKRQQDEQRKEDEEKRFNRILAGVSVFAVVSVIWDFCSIVKDASGLGQDSPWSAWFARGFIVMGLVLIVVLWNKILRKKHEETNIR